MAGVPENGTRYASFLLRLWQTGHEGKTQPSTNWQGEAEHIQTRQCWTFDTLEDLLSLLRHQLQEVGPGKQD